MRGSEREIDDADRARRPGRRPRCAIVIPVYNLAAITRQCLGRLLASPPGLADVEIVVVDDGSTDGTHAMLAEYAGRVAVVTHPANRGFAESCNDGARAADPLADYLVFLNNDTLPLPGWLDALVGYAESHPEAAAVGAKLLYPDGTVQHAGVAIDAEGHPRHIYVGFPGDHPAVNKARPFQTVTGACLLVRREAFDGAGGFDTAFRNGFEDTDLCLRLREAGAEVHYCPACEVVHLESVSEGRRVHEMRNYDLYRERWKDRVRPDDLEYYRADGLLSVEYPNSCPLLVHVDPALGVIAEDARRTDVDGLLLTRARQVRELLREVVRLKLDAATA